ncbi:hypothetical protein Tcan_08557 [Toxocara canis]|uniref:Uncharacterized protein n=1 Tax=Toxocara canis TaxID=6265 RepID=A0A0B2VA17_TOXCA|nr:hypothetical protein Tcan_08557 [Toxocara canis]
MRSRKNAGCFERILRDFHGTSIPFAKILPRQCFCVERSLSVHRVDFKRAIFSIAHNEIF